MKTGIAKADAAAPDADSIEAQMRQLMETIYRTYSYDFRDYTGASQKRRVAQALTQFKCPNIPTLQAGVERDPTLFQQLLQYLTIPVSEMFRDPGFFLTLREQVLPVLQTYPSLKIWVAGCSTGEEAYSLAILLKEEGLLERSLIYATDINATSLDKARRGIFPLASVRTHTTNYQQAGGRRAFSDYYIAAYDGAIFDKTLAENITFADHSLATDSVFSETQLVLCRNVLIYFNRTLQDRALGLFHESLSHRGFLGLGSKESIDFSAYANRFDPLVKAQRLFRKH
jgi:chemotaxis protein methyltransferase CheR